ncbi:MAG: ATP-binding protein [Candidatus Altarchaeum sp.]|nr:ATP-binding protein [Candidatus Altarchaeum sp.]
MFENVSEEEKINILINSKILTNRNDKILCTVSGILLFGKEPTKFLSQNGIIYAYFEGNEISGSLIDRKELNVTIAENIKNICEIIKLNLQRSSKIEGLERIEKEEIPERVIREAIANACIHRDYTIYWARIRIFMFDDRLEIRSPGVPPNNVNVESMKTGISVYRNPIIVRFINDYHLAEGMGRGIPMIIKETNKISGKKPKIEILENETNLIIYFPKRKQENPSGKS